MRISISAEPFQHPAQPASASSRGLLIRLFRFLIWVHTLKVIVITQNHRNFSSSAKTNNNNNTVPRISQAPPNRFKLHRTCICIRLSSRRLVYSASFYGIYFKSYADHEKKRKSRISSPSTTASPIPRRTKIDFWWGWDRF